MIDESQAEHDDTWGMPKEEIAQRIKDGLSVEGVNMPDEGLDLERLDAWVQSVIDNRRKRHV